MPCQTQAATYIQTGFIKIGMIITPTKTFPDIYKQSSKAFHHAKCGETIQTGVAKYTWKHEKDQTNHGLSLAFSCLKFDHSEKIL